MDTLFLLIFIMLCLGFAGWLFFLWAVKSGQYDDVERPKYRMMDDDEEIYEAEKKTKITAQSIDSLKGKNNEKS